MEIVVALKYDKEKLLAQTDQVETEEVVKRKYKFLRYS